MTHKTQENDGTLKIEMGHSVAELNQTEDCGQFC